MSNFLAEGSPMDISDATASPLESIGTSPEELKFTNAETAMDDHHRPLLAVQKLNGIAETVAVSPPPPRQTKQELKASDRTLSHDLQQNALNANAALSGGGRRNETRKSTMTMPGGALNESNENLLPGNLRLPLEEAAARHTTTQQRQAIERTLANSHPLMSPNGTDSDSELSPPPPPTLPSAKQGKLPSLVEHSDFKCHSNFPDVIPTNERRLPLTSHAHAHGRGGPDGDGTKVISLPAHNKLVMLRTRSPDILSSESEAEVSQYQAAVEANFQSVALLPNSRTAAGGHKSSGGGGGGGGESRRKTVGAGREDISSLDSISNHSFDDDEDMEHNLASLSPSSSVIDGLDEDVDDMDNDDDYEGPDDAEEDFVADDVTLTTPCGVAQSPLGGEQRDGLQHSPLPQYSASDEHRDSRNWQKITLPDGRVREIDMRVIEPYKRVLSHGGYLKAGGHNAIVIFCACHLPDHSRADYNYVMDNLFLYVMKTLEQLVTEDYVLIYLHGGSHRRNVPPFPWLKKCYQLIDRRLRKSLKSMYLVHPTFWIRSIVWMARPFVSSKFWRKLVYVKTLTELGTYVAVEKAAIPDKVKQYDAKLQRH